jgi:copper(I)-binding protein
LKSFIMALSSALALFCAASAHAQVTVSDPWVRAPAPGQKIAGVYMQITSGKTAFLISGSSPASKSVEIHEMALDNNVMKMRPVVRLELPAGKPVELKPGGYHMMLVDLVRPLDKGDTVPITLTVEGADGQRHTIDVKAGVRDFTAMGRQHGAK